MDKNILHSVLETVVANQTINICFAEPYAELTGDYLVLQSKTGRGRGGSRILEVRSVTDSTRVISTLQIEGKDKTLGTGTSDVIMSLTVDGKVHGLEDPTESPRRVRAVRAETQAEKPVKARMVKREPSQSSGSTATLIATKVATALGNVLAENPKTVFKLTGRSSGSHITGEWQVKTFTHENNVLCMECVDTQNSERTLSFDSSVDGVNLKDAEVVYTS